MSRSFTVPEAGPVPREGDVLVVECPDHAPLGHALQPWGEPPQLKFANPEVASLAADRFARAERVNVWVVEDGRFRLVYQHRPKSRRRPS